MRTEEELERAATLLNFSMLKMSEAGADEEACQAGQLLGVLAWVLNKGPQEPFLRVLDGLERFAKNPGPQPLRK